MHRTTIRIALVMVCLGWVLAACGQPAAVAPSAAPAPPSPRPSEPPAPAAAVTYDDIAQGVTPEGYQYLGDPAAPLTLVMYSDFLWTACAFHVLDTEPQIVETYIKPGKLRLVYRHLLQLGDRSELLAEASECAAAQGGFWEMRRELYARIDELYADAAGAVAAAATSVGLDPAAVEACIAAQTYQEAVRADYAAATAAGIRSRPVFAIGDETLIGAQRFSIFQERIDAALAGN